MPGSSDQSLFPLLIVAGRYSRPFELLFLIVRSPFVFSGSSVGGGATFFPHKQLACQFPPWLLEVDSASSNGGSLSACQGWARRDCHDDRARSPARTSRCSRPQPQPRNHTTNRKRRP